MTNDTCGEPCLDGTPCERPMGWGTPRAIGPCKDHQRMGRPTKYTEDRKQDILTAARNGTTIEGCARAGGIHHSTLYDWLDSIPEFSEEFRHARAEGEQRLIQDEETDPEFLLERSYKYTKSQEIEHRGEGQPVVIYSEADEQAHE